MHDPKIVKTALKPLVPAWVFEQGLRANEIATLLKLWRHRPSKGPATVWPCRKEVLRSVRINKDTLNEVLNRLERLGLIRREGAWHDGRKRVLYHLHAPDETIIRNGGTITHFPSSQAEGSTSSQTEGITSSQKKGWGSYPRKIEKEVCGLQPLDAHSHPLWFSEVQAAFPKVDCAACWAKFVGHFNEKGLQPTRERFEEWCGNEKRLLRKPGVVAKKVEAAPLGWIDWLRRQLDAGVDESVHGQLIAALINQSFGMLPRSWQDRARQGLAGNEPLPGAAVA